MTRYSMYSGERIRSLGVGDHGDAVSNGGFDAVAGGGVYRGHRSPPDGDSGIVSYSCHPRHSNGSSAFEEGVVVGVRRGVTNAAPATSAASWASAASAAPISRRVEPKDPDVVYGRRSNGYCNGTKHGTDYRCGKFSSLPQKCYGEPSKSDNSKILGKLTSPLPMSSFATDLQYVIHAYM